MNSSKIHFVSFLFAVFALIGGLFILSNHKIEALSLDGVAGVWVTTGGEGSGCTQETLLGGFIEKDQEVDRTMSVCDQGGGSSGPTPPTEPTPPTPEPPISLTPNSASGSVTVIVLPPGGEWNNDLVAYDKSCTIKLGESSCLAGFSWRIYLRPGEKFAVTTPNNFVVSEDPSTEIEGYKIEYPSRSFFFYRGGDEIKSINILANCVTGSDWNGTKCAAPTDSGNCFDGIKNQNETGIDVGGVCGNPPTATCSVSPNPGVDSAGIVVGIKLVSSKANYCTLKVDDHIYWSNYNTSGTLTLTRGAIGTSVGSHQGKVSCSTEESGGPGSANEHGINSAWSTCDYRVDAAPVNCISGTVWDTVTQKCIPTETCFDGIKNQNETGIDVGGVCDTVCSSPLTKIVTAQCGLKDGVSATSGLVTRRQTKSAYPQCTFGTPVTTSNSTWVSDNCVYPTVLPETCLDGIKNQDETSIDKGGVCDTDPRDLCPNTPGIQTTLPCPSSSTIGTLTGDNCEIVKNGNTCTTKLTLNIINPVAGAATNITKAGNVQVASGITPPAKPNIVVNYPNTTFYLNHNSVTLASKTINATCVSGTGWNGEKCVDNDDGGTQINGGWSEWSGIYCGTGPGTKTHYCINPLLPGGDCIKSDGSRGTNESISYTKVACPVTSCPNNDEKICPTSCPNNPVCPTECGVKCPSSQKLISGKCVNKMGWTES